MIYTTVIYKYLNLIEKEINSVQIHDECILSEAKLMYVCVCTQRQMLFVQKDKIMNLYPFFQGYKNASISLMIANLTDCVSLKMSSHVLYQCQSYFQRFIYKKKLSFFQSCIHQ